MTLTTVIGSSGSGKTTFLNDVHKSHDCIYIRQYHFIRPYIIVSKIPNFNPITLPYWDIYVNEGVDKTIRVGGTIAGEFTAGLSGGQRKILLFELICQRIQNYHQSKLLVILDEPFAGVTDDFIPFITKRLQLIRQYHNILLVTNDHVQTLTSLADNTITVSAIDRNHVKMNHMNQVNREKLIAALSLGKNYIHETTNKSALQFFINIEIITNLSIRNVSIFIILCYSLLILTYWNTSEVNAIFVLIGADFVSFLCINPYLLALVEWRNAIIEESEALVHSSKDINKTLKTLLTLLLILIVSFINYGCINAVVNGFRSINFWIAMFFDSFASTFPLVALSIYTNLSIMTVQNIGNMPFLLMIFFSTTFSPGSGLPVLKDLRYLFTRFYFWCIVPDVQEQMEGCPKSIVWNMILLVLTSFIGVFIFILYYFISRYRRNNIKDGTTIKTYHKNDTTKLSHDKEYIELQNELYNRPMKNDNNTKGKVQQQHDTLDDKVPIGFEDDESLLWQEEL